MAVTRYINFDLVIRRSSVGYHVEVVDSPVGQAECEFILPFTVDELARFERITLPRTRHFVLREGSQSAGPPLNAQEFGQRLFQAVFTDNLATHLMRSLDRANAQQAGLRIRLRLDSGVAELADLPWEYLYVPALARFAVLSNQMAIVRYLKLGQPEKLLRVRPPLRVLVLVADPRDAPALNVEHEWSNLQQATAPLVARQLITLERLAEPTLAALRQRLRQGEIHIFHFIGHGFFDEQVESGGLLFEEGTGQGHIVSADVLATRLHDHAPLRLVYLNACEGAGTAVQNFFAGVAQRLVQQGVPAVIAMQFPISDRAAIALAQEFYQALADGYPVDAALGEARKVVYEQDATSSEWGTPVLFMRSDDGRLFDMDTGGAVATHEQTATLLTGVQPQQDGDKVRQRGYQRFWPALAGLLVLLLALLAWRVWNGITPPLMDPAGQEESVDAGAAPAALPMAEPTATSAPTPTPIVFASPTPVLPAQPKVLVADFANCARRFNLADPVRTALNADSARLARTVEVDETGPFINEEEATAAANEAQAQVVIWGECREGDEVLVNIAYGDGAPPPFDELLFEPRSLTLVGRSDKASRFAVASILYAFGQLGTASQMLDSITQQEEIRNSVDYLWLQANVNTRQEQWQEAMEHYQAALAASSAAEATATVAFLTANLSLVQRLAAHTSRENRDTCKANDPMIRYSRAISLTIEAGLSVTQTALLHTGHGMALMVCHYSASDEENTAQIVRDTQYGIDQGLAAAYALRSYIDLMRFGNPIEAEYNACKALNRAPELPVPHFVLGRIYWERGWHEEARLHLEQSGQLARYQWERNRAAEQLSRVLDDSSLLTPARAEMVSCDLLTN